MSDDTKSKANNPGSFSDPLTEFLRAGARELIAQAVESELKEYLSQFNETLSDGRLRLVRNGYLPERTIQSGIGDLPIKVPKVRDRIGGIHFTSKLLPPYLKRTKSIEELIPWLYLKGISSGDYSEALCALLGEQAKGLSSNTVCRLKAKWLDEFRHWSNRDLSEKRYVYFWADGIYSNVRLDDKLCLLVIIGVRDDGVKELLAVSDGYRESTNSWEDVLIQLRERALTIEPKLVTADGAMGFWAALTRIYPTAKQQRCWVHKTANILAKLPKSIQPKVKVALKDIYLAETKEQANKAFDLTLKRFKSKYPKAMECLEKDRDELLVFYDFPAEHWVHIRTSNPIESAFATVRLRGKRAKNCGSRDTTLSMVFKLLESAQKNWRRIRGFRKLELVINNVKFKDCLQVNEETNKEAA